jgi:hypothetical protein
VKLNDLQLDFQASTVPYSASVLTRLLSNTLGSNRKAVVLVSVSPRKADLNQTLFNLGFVAKCR